MYPKKANCLLPGLTVMVMLLTMFISPVVNSAPGDVSPDNVWTQARPSLALSKRSSQQTPKTFSVHELNGQVLEELLSNAPLETPDRNDGVVLSIPMPDGSYSRFLVEESPILSDLMQSRYPDIKTYSGQGIDDPLANVRFDVTMFGFRAMIISSNGTIFVDPVEMGQTDLFMSFYRRDMPLDNETFTCGYNDSLDSFGEYKDYFPKQRASGEDLRTYRLAIVTSGEYTALFGGPAGANAQIATTINRVTGIYENDVAVRFDIVQTVTFLDSTTDAFDTIVNGAMLDANQVVCDDSVGSSNYDIGHVFSRAKGGGLAQQGVCQGNKAKGATARNNPVGDVFDVDYVAHEMGHQMSGSHTFNGTTDNCGGGNRVASSAYEPGSGSTIMAYAGICDSENVQPNSDAYFHARSLAQIIAYQSGGGNCGTVTSTGNNPPTANAQSDYTIPRGTPFKLTGSGSDPDGDPLTYCWEQYDLGDPSPPPNTSNGPLFRSLFPTTSPSRTFPVRDSIITGGMSPWERLPTVNRSMTFRLTVRDNRANGGGVGWDDMTVTVDGAPFALTSPNGGEVFPSGCDVDVTWDVGGGDVADDVNIWLSTDGGYTIPTLLATTDNDGSATVTLPCIATNQARIEIAAVGNIFFDLSDNNFTIQQVDPVISSSATGGAVDGDCERLVTFNATVSDDCEMLASDVDVTVSIPSGNASFATPTVNKVQSDQSTVQVSGSVLVYGLTASPVSVNIRFDGEDNCGATETQTEIVSVYDTTKPSINCPSDLVFECDDIGPFGTPTATDNCDSDPDISLIIRDSIPGDCPQEYELQLTYQARDFAGNTDQCQQIINVIDTTPPVIVCPEPSELEVVFTNPSHGQVFFEVTATDNCNDSLEIVCDSVSGSTFDIGHHEISCTVDDLCGNVDSCSFGFHLLYLDIHPTSCPNPLSIVPFLSGDVKDYDFNEASSESGELEPTITRPSPKSLTPVAILGTDILDVHDLDLSTININGITPLRVRYQDVATPASEIEEYCGCVTDGKDGFVDLTLFFPTEDLIATMGALEDGDVVQLIITGFHVDGDPFFGGDCVIIRGPNADPDLVSLDISDNLKTGIIGAYPNPFNPTTTISFSLKQASSYQLVIYNIAGQEVTRFDGAGVTGINRVTWNASSYASGIYIYSLTALGKTESEKMMLLK